MCLGRGGELILPPGEEVCLRGLGVGEDYGGARRAVGDF